MNWLDILQTLIAGYPTPSELIDPRYPVWLQEIGGLHLTLWITAISLLFAAPPAAALALLRTSSRSRRNGSGGHTLARCAAWIAAGTVEVVRGIPVILLVLLVFHLPYPLFGIRVPAVILAVLALTLYACMYMSELFRSGFRAVGEGTIDAARVLGLSRWQVFLKIRAPIAVRTMLPGLLGLAITVFKDTSILTVVAVPELTYTSRQIMTAQPVQFFAVLVLLLALYWSFASLGELITDKLDAAWGGARLTGHLSERSLI